MMLEELQTVTYGDVALRIGLATLFGCLLGLDRDMKNKPIDFRAFMIVCVSTCVVAILGQELYANLNGNMSLDIGKIISGALTGIGFLGAGAILKNNDDNQVIGTATGASIWGSSIIGLCLGFGYLGLAFGAFITIFVTLFVIGCFYKTIHGTPDKESLD